MLGQKTLVCCWWLLLVTCFLIFNNFKLLLKFFALSLGENYSLKTSIGSWENNEYKYSVSARFSKKKEDLRRRQEVFIIFEWVEIIFYRQFHSLCKRRNSSSSKVNCVVNACHFLLKFTSKHYFIQCQNINNQQLWLIRNIK